jgi:hypothetical protein
VRGDPRQRHLVSICAWCGFLRVTARLYRRRTGADRRHLARRDVAVTHGICPACKTQEERRLDARRR